MKILFITHFFHPHIGGIEKHVLNLSLELIIKGHQVTIITKKHSPELKTIQTYKKIKIIRISYPNIKYIGLLSIWLQLLIFHFKLLISTNVLHIHDVFIWYLPFRFLSWNKKVFTTFHGWQGQYPIPKKQVTHRLIAQFLSTKTIAVGEYQKKYFKINPNKIIYGAVTLPTKKYKKLKKTIVYVGRLDKDTPLPILLPKLKKLKDFTINFHGNGELAGECAKIGKVHGFSDPTSSLKKSEICIASGYLSILESFAYRCTTITSHNNQLKKDYYQNTPFNKFLTNKIQKLSSKTISSAYQYAKSQSWKKLANTYEKLWYTSSIGGK